MKKKNETIEEKLLYREPIIVTEIKELGNCGYFPICPRCDNLIEREYQAFCDVCGQMLKWKNFSRAKIRS